MNLHIHTSTIADGSMKSTDRNYASVLSARAAFLSGHAIDPTDTTLVQLTYDGNDYRRYHTLNDADRGDGIVRPPTFIADALVTTKPGHALFLPVADCIAAVIHDTASDVLMVSHLGRHNLTQFGGTDCIRYLTTNHGVDVADLSVWLSPAAGPDEYPLYAFDNRSLHDVATEQLLSAGIPAANITRSPIDSASDKTYYSHSQFLNGNRTDDGRFAIVARMVP